MPLEAMREYRDGRGEKVNIRCATKVNPEWLCSIQGNWYEKSSGRFLWYNPDTGEHELREQGVQDINMPTPPVERRNQHADWCGYMVGHGECDCDYGHPEQYGIM